MNVFFLDRDPVTAARYHGNKHVIKMILEGCQLLSTAARESYKKDIGYSSGWRHHPCAKWVRMSDANFCWLLEMTKALCDEYSFRYGKSHKCSKIVNEMYNHIYIQFPPGISRDFTSPYLAMPDDCKHENPVIAYRQYYVNYKQHLLKYKNREIPFWIKELKLGEQT
jgi:hypothetical protein